MPDTPSKVLDYVAAGDRYVGRIIPDWRDCE